MFCSQCGKEINAQDARFCPSCGKEFQEAPKPPTEGKPLAASEPNRDDLFAELAKQPSERGVKRKSATAILIALVCVGLTSGGIWVLLFAKGSKTQEGDPTASQLIGGGRSEKVDSSAGPERTVASKALTDEEQLHQLEKEKQAIESELERVQSELRKHEQELEAQKSRLQSITNVNTQPKQQKPVHQIAEDDSATDQSLVDEPKRSTHRKQRVHYVAFSGLANPSDDDSDRSKRNGSNDTKQSDRDSIQKKKRDLEQELERMKSLIKKDQQKENEHRALVAKARETIDQIAKWQDARIVLTDATNRAMALQISPDRSSVTVTHAADSQIGPWATAAAVRAGATWTYSPELVRDFKDVKEGTVLSSTQAQSIIKLFEPRDYYHPTSDPERPFITFCRDGKKDKTLARYIGHSNGCLSIQNLNGSIEDLPVARVTRGSARLVDEKETQFLEDGEFLDACLFRAIQELSRERDSNNYSPPVRLAIQVNSGGANVDRGFCNYVGRRLGVDGSTNMARCAQLLESELYTKLSKLHDVDSRFNIVSPEQMSDEVKKTIDGYNAIGSAFGWASLASLIFGGDAKSTANLVIASGKIQKEALDVEMRYHEELVRRCPFSHVLEVRVSPPAGDGLYHLDVRLINSKSRAVVFADQGDRRYVVESSLYFPASGELAYAKSELGSAIRMGLMESNPILPSCGSVHKAIDDPLGCLVIREGGRSGSEVYRKLFGLELENASDKNSKFQLVTTDKIPKTERLRFAGYQMLRSVLPPSGFVAKVQGSEAKVTIGGITGLKNGDRLQVAAQKLDGSSGSVAMYPLSVPIVVTSVSDKNANVRIFDSGLQEVFPEDKIDFSDIVYATRSEMPVVTIAPFERLGPIDQKTAVNLKWGNPARFARLNAAYENATVEVHTKLAALLRHWNVPTVPWNQAEEGRKTNVLESVESYGRFLPSKARVTHVITGGVALLSEDTCRFQFVIFDPQTKQIFKKFDLDMDISR